MPVLRHAKKKLRQDKKRKVRNRKVKDTFKELVKKAKIAKTPKALSLAFKSLDKAAKQNIIHKNKAARLKSSLTKFVASGATLAASPKKSTKTKKKKPSSKKS